MFNKNNVLRIVAGLILLAGSVHAAAQAQLYFIHPDHLNTPRLIANATGQTVWTWANDDPFGANAPNENPSGLGNFTCNLRLPGQYFDKETNTHYNYFRDYDPAIGRYIQSDPIGLQGGINTYGYANQNPLTFTDPRGEAAGAAVIGGGVLIIGGAIYMSGSSGKKAIKSIAQKIQELCTPSNKDPCDKQQEQEEEDCGKYWGHWSYGGCMERARIRGDMCRRGIPNPPPPWSDADVNGWAPPRAPRGK